MTEKKPKVPEKEVDKLQKQFDEFDNQVKELTQDRMNAAPKEEQEPQTKLSGKQLDNSSKIWLKPKRTVMGRDKFNERFREAYNFSKEYVQFIAENKEIIGESIQLWTRPFGGMPAEEWDVPVNKPVWGPRYLAEQIRKCQYHRMRMEQNTSVGADGIGSYFGSMIVDITVPRLTAEPVSPRRSIFMGAAA
jgi:hypothetical protein